MRKFNLAICVFILKLSITSVFAQHQDSINNVRRNIIKFNITANSFLDKAILFEYEHVLKRNRSFSIQAGYVASPFSSLLDSTRFETDIKKSGWAMALDYRFYLKKENKYAAPHGIYVAPFITYHNFINERSLEVQSESGSWEPVVIDSKVTLLGIGGQLGYQFIIKKRLAIDLLLLGPSVTNYNVIINLTGNLPDQEIDEELQQIITNLLSKYPFVGDLLEDNVAETNGRVNTWDLGFRYSIHLGFCF